MVTYYSRKLPEAVRRYSISEQELTGMLANITAFKHILRNVNFTVYCDHSALVHITKAKKESLTLRLQKLVELLMDYKFSIKFLKGKDMYVTDFFSRNPDNETESPNEIIPIAFLLKDTEEWDEAKPIMRKKLKIVNAHHCSVTKYYIVLWEFNTSQKELLLVSSRSISSLISGGDSSCSWVLVCALFLL